MCLIAISLASALAAASWAPRSAFASFSTCRTDPEVYLSNGKVFSLSVVIYGTASSVKHIVYSLHGPTGTSVTKLVYTGASFAGKESFAYVADDSPYTYTSHIVVTTVSRTRVRGATTVTNASGTAQSSATFFGYSDQDLGARIYFKA